jgi:hypothetical protein
LPQSPGGADVHTFIITLTFSVEKLCNFSKVTLCLVGADDHAPSEDDMNVRVNQYPQLRQLCWNRPDDIVVNGETALALYERNWRFVDCDAITISEQRLLDSLVAVHGNGHFLAA